MIITSSYLNDRLTPRCRLIISLGRRSSKRLDCSSSNMVRELGLERCKTVRSLSTVVIVSIF